MTDPATNPVPVDELLSKPYLKSRAALINLEKAITVKHGNPASSSDTIYLATADEDGNACSFIASNYAGETFLAAIDICGERERPGEGGRSSPPIRCSVSASTTSLVVEVAGLKMPH